MRKRKHILDVYVGGEEDSPEEFSPEFIDRFFSLKKIFIIFLILVVMLLIAGV
jgi:hypothetical protein